ncbi:MAG: glycosyltransferase family 92 protein [Verrucomicrobia bacterium]|nr:glycosyltransferase family 92 protein [Verrucomicrobiota bacterium]
MSSICIDLFGYELAIVSMFRNTAPYLKEWVEYHQMVGVDHFWLYNDASTDDWEEVLKPYMEQGLVEVFYWPAGKPDWVPGQLKAFEDGLSRSLGVAKWVALIDQDEFIVPMQDKTIIECLNNHFSKAHAVYVNWRNFGTNHITLGEGEFMLSKLVKCSAKNHPRSCVGKSIIQPEFIKIDEMWSPHFCPLQEGIDYYNGDADKTLSMLGSDLITDGKNHSNYIVINHYAFRDEKYFKDERLPRDANPNLMIRMEEEFNAMYDYKILEQIKKHFPKMYETKWKGPYDSKVRSK